MKLVYVNEILENAKYANRDSGETDVLKTVQLIVKAGHVIKILENVGSVKEGFGEVNVLKTVQLIVKFVLMRINVSIAPMDGMVLLVKSPAQHTAETEDLVKKSLVIASFVLWGILVTRAPRTVVNIVTKLKCVTKKMENAKTVRPVEEGIIVRKCVASNAKIQRVSKTSPV